METAHLLNRMRYCLSLGLCLLCSQSIEANNTTFRGFGNNIDRYIQESAQRYQVSEAMLRGLIKMEDGWYNKISPTGATGVGQFTVGTWNWLATTERGSAIGMQFITSSNRGTRYDPRRNNYINTLATGLLARWHIEQFQLRGIAVNDSNLYMAHNIGLDGLHRAILGKSTSEDLRNMRRNGMKKGMTVQGFIAYQKSRYERHKAEANFMSTSSPSSVSVATAKASTSAKSSQNAQLAQAGYRWVEPSENQILWILPN